MAARKKHHPRKPRERARVPAASLPRAVPRPDLTLWITAGAAGVLAVASFCQISAWMVLRLGGIAGARLHMSGTGFPQEENFWRLVEYEDFSSAAKLASPSLIAWAAACGPILLLVIPWIAARWTNPWTLAASAGVAGRLLAPLVYVLRVAAAWLRGDPMPRQVSLEEYRLWVLLGVPVGFSLLVEIVVIASGVHRALPRSGLLENPVRLIALAAGACFGFGILVVLRSS